MNLQDFKDILTGKRLSTLRYTSPHPRPQMAVMMILDHAILDKGEDLISGCAGKWLVFGVDIEEVASALTETDAAILRGLGVWLNEEDNVLEMRL